jgi:hypothetical protein
METTLATFKPSRTIRSVSVNHFSPVAWYHDFIERVKFFHFFIMAFAVLFGSCLGSVAAMYVFMAQAPTWVFAVGLFATMANLVASISQAPTKWMVAIFAFSVAVNTVLTLIFI